MNGYTTCWIVGAGAIGSTLAALLSENSGIRVVLVGASPHWQKVRDEGLLWACIDDDPKKVALNTATPDEMPSLGAGDLVLLTGKLPDLEKAAGWLGPKLAPDTGVIALQNGLGVQELAGQYLNRPVDRGLAFFGARSAEAGQVKYFKEGRIRLDRSPVTEALCNLLEKARIHCYLVDDFAPVEWLKLTINCLANPLSGLLSASSLMTADPVLNPAKEAILQEVKAVAAAGGVNVAFSIDDYNQALTSDENYPSLKTDLDRGRPTEIEFLNGAVCRVGRERKVPTPVNDLVVSLIRYLEQDHFGPKA